MIREARMTDILILLGSESDRSITEKGLAYLKELGVSYRLHIASAHRSPAFVHELVENFDKNKGKVLICVAGKSAHLAGVAAAFTVKPVLAVPVFNVETSGFDALLSMSQMPAGVPVATMGFGKSGFANACLQAAQIMAIAKMELEEKLRKLKLLMAEQVKEQDEKYREEYYPC